MKNCNYILKKLFDNTESCNEDELDSMYKYYCTSTKAFITLCEGIGNGECSLYNSDLLVSEFLTAVDLLFTIAKTCGITKIDFGKVLSGNVGCNVVDVYGTIEYIAVHAFNVASFLYMLLEEFDTNETINSIIEDYKHWESV